MALGDTIGSVIIKFLSDTKGFDAGVTSMQKSVKSFSDGAGQVATNLRSMGMQAIGLGTTLAAPFLAGIKGMMDFDHEFQKVMSILSQPLNAAGIEKFKADITEMSKTMGIDLVEATRGVYQAISSGVPQENVMTFMETAAKASKAGTTDLFTTVTALAGAVNAYGAETLSAEHAADVMFQTVKGGMIEFNDLAQGLGQVTAFAATAGVSFEELGAALEGMTKVGMVPAEAFTALRGILNSIVSPSKDAAQAAEELGIEWDAAAIKSKGWSAMMTELADKTDGNVESIARIIPEIRGMNGALVLGAQSGKVFAEALENAHNSTGALDSAFDEIEKSLKSTWEKIKTNTKAILVEIAEAVRDDLTEALDDALTKLKELATWIDTNPEEFKQYVNAWKDWAITITAVGASLLALSALASVIRNIAVVYLGITKLVVGLGLLKTAFGAIAFVVADLTAAFPLLTIGVASFVTSLAALVSGGILVALGLVVYTIHGIRKANEELADSTKKTFDFAKKSVEALGLSNNKTLTQMQADIDKTTDAEDKLAKQMAFTDEVAKQHTLASLEREKTIQENLMKTVTALGEQDNALALSNTAWLIYKDTGVTSAEAVVMAQQALSEEVDNSTASQARAAERAVGMYDQMTEADKKYLTQALATFVERKKFADMTAEQQTQSVADHLKANEFKNASDAERATVLELYHNHEISLDQAILAVKNNLTNEEIALMEKGVQALEIMNERKKNAGKQDSANLAEKFGKDKKSLMDYVAETDKFINELEAKRAALDTQVKAAAAAGDSEAFARLRTQEAEALQLIEAASARKVEIQNQAVANAVENAAKIAQLDYEKHARDMDGAEIERAALAERKARLGENFQAVIDNLGQYRSIYDQMSADQKAAVDALIANVLDVGATVNNTQQGMLRAQTEAAEAASLAMQKMTAAGTEASQNFQMSFMQQAEMVGKTSPQMTESIALVTASMDQNKATIAQLNEEIAFQEQAIRNLTTAGSGHEAQIATYNESLAALRAQAKDAQEGLDQMSAGLSGNRTAMQEASTELVKYIREVEQEIQAKRASGEVTTELQARLVNLNAQYDVLKMGMTSAGLTIDAVTSSTDRAKTAAQQTVPAIGDIGKAAADAAGPTQELSRALGNDLPTGAKKGTEETKGVLSRFVDWVYALLGPVRDAIQYVFDFSQTGSPSMNMEIAAGLQETTKVYRANVGNIMRMMSSARDAQVDLYRSMSADAMASLGGGPRVGGGIGISASAPQGRPEKRASRWVVKNNTDVGLEQTGDGQFQLNIDMSSERYFEYIENRKRRPINQGSVGLSGSVAGTDRLAEIFARIEERLARLRDDERRDKSLEMSALAQGALTQQQRWALAYGLPAGSNGALSIPELEQDSLAEKIGESVARAMSGGLPGILGRTPIVNVTVPPPPPPIVTYRRDHADRFPNDTGGENDDRRRFY